jgi:hypothetical protein
MNRFNWRLALVLICVLAVWIVGILAIGWLINYGRIY